MLTRNLVISLSCHFHDVCLGQLVDASVIRTVLWALLWMSFHVSPDVLLHACLLFLFDCFDVVFFMVRLGSYFLTFPMDAMDGMAP